MNKGTVDNGKNRGKREPKAHATYTMLPSAYTSGAYFAALPEPDQDSLFKVMAFLQLFHRVVEQCGITIHSYIDVGCGSGGTLEGIANGLRASGHELQIARGYDVSPHVTSLQVDGLEFVHGDFCTAGDRAELVTLFDVIEHVPTPIDFIKCVADKCDFMGLHIPLDHTLANEILNRYKFKLSCAGHLIYLDQTTALNLLTLSGLVTLDYDYTFGFLAPSGRETQLQRISFPFRRAVSFVSPWVLSRTLGGVSLMVLGATASGQLRLSESANRAVRD